MFLSNIFKKSIKNISNVLFDGNKNEIYFHEDSFCQVEFIPRENILHLEKRNKFINEFSSEHFSGTGYKDMYIREENPIPILQRNIHIDDVDKLLRDLGFTKAYTVYYGYSNEKIKCNNTEGYRLNNSNIFFEYKNQIITAFWINGFRFHQDESIKSNLKKALLAISDKYNLVLNDWDLSIMVDLSKETEIEKYLNEEF